MVDAEKISEAGIPSVQLRTSGFCHLDATIVTKGLDALAEYDLDLIIRDDVVSSTETMKGGAATNTLYRNYERYKASIYNQDEDIFAAYPLWITNQYITSELDFLATESGQLVGFVPPEQRRSPRPEQTVIPIEPPVGTTDIAVDALRETIQMDNEQTSALSRYTDLLSIDNTDDIWL